MDDSVLPDWLNQLMRRALFLPEQASAHASSIDALHYLEIGTMVGLSLLVGLAVVWFAWRYRRRPGRERGERVDPPTWLEVGVYGGLLLFFVALWIVGFRQYLDMHRSPDSALEVYVTGKQWMWKFAYPEGAGSVGVLYVPQGRPVRLILTSRDVIHSFFVPAFRVKRDAVPGLYTSIGFVPSEAGSYPILCAEMCGNGHSRMRGMVEVLAEEEWLAWRQRQRIGPRYESLVSEGVEVAARHGCFQCHSLDGARLLGPSWEGIYGSEVELSSGESVVVDEAYITESMMDPATKIVAGFAPVMPSYRGQMEPPEVAAVVELIKSLRRESTSTELRSHER